MELPENVKRIGKIEHNRRIYIEDYVLSYLELLKEETEEENVQIILYGKSYKEVACHIFIIYGAGKEAWNEESGERKFFGKYEAVGCLDLEVWKSTAGMCEGILLGNREGGHPVQGYYIFYEDNSAMKQQLCASYFVKASKQEVLPELRALSRESEEVKASESFLFTLIRAAVICIFIIFCAIAVTTVNSFEKLKTFADTAVQIETLK